MATKKRVIILSAIAGVSILLVVFVANGSQYEDAWLYLTGLWIVLIPLFELSTQKNDQ